MKTKTRIPARADAFISACSALQYTLPGDVDFMAVVEAIDNGSRANLGFKTLTSAVRKAAAHLDRRVYEDRGSLRIGATVHNAHVLAYKAYKAEIAREEAREERYKAHVLAREEHA